MTNSKFVINVTILLSNSFLVATLDRNEMKINLSEKKKKKQILHYRVSFKWVLNSVDGLGGVGP